jgi:hypothetical protein
MSIRNAQESEFPELNLALLDRNNKARTPGPWLRPIETRQSSGLMLAA